MAEEGEIDMNDPAALTAAYVDAGKKIDELEGRQMLLKANLERVLEPQRVAVDQKPVWFYGDYVVSWVKGRRNDKLDKVRLKRELLLAGVGVEVVEGAFEKATTSTQYAPYLRVAEGTAPPEE